MTLAQLQEDCTHPLDIIAGLQAYAAMIIASDLPEAEKERIANQVFLQILFT